MKFPFKSRLLALATASCMVSTSSADPSWWTMGDDPVIRNAPAANRAVANIGQAKWMAKCALEALARVMPDVADAIEADLVGTGKPIASWDPPVSPDGAEAQFSPLLLGQLKSIAAPFYDHLNQAAPGWVQAELTRNQTLQTGNHYPWTTTEADDDNRAIANIGQLKAVFALDFSRDGETGSAEDMIPDLWEHAVVAADGGAHWTSIGEIDNLNAFTAGASSGVGNPFVTVGMHTGSKIASLIHGKNPLTTMPLYTRQDHHVSPYGEYERNPDFWASGLGSQLTCISPANTTDAVNGRWYLIGATAITKRIVVMVNHSNFYVPNGQEIRFVTMDDTVVSIAVLASMQVGDSDIQLGVLASDLPPAIKPCLIPPADFRDYFPKKLFAVDGVSKGGVLALLLDQEEKGIVGDLSAINRKGVELGLPRDAHASSFHEAAQGGDSGNPGFFIIDGQLMLVMALKNTSGYGFSVFGDNWENFNDVVDQLNSIAGVSGEDYQPKIANLGGFAKFEPGGP